jgi:hypothetical protein
MPRGQDGGKWALAGFLYQILGTASITARASSPIPISDLSELDEIDALLITLVDDGEGLQAQHERLQDAIFTKDDKCVIVQFKFTTVSRKIYIEEAKEIIKRLDKAAEDAKSEGQSVTTCVLITNRELASEGKGGESAAQYWEKAREDRRERYELRYVFRSRADLESDLYEFGRKYGLFEDEIEAGVDCLIGGVFRETGELSNIPINKGYMVRAFTGSSEARPLTIASVAELSHKELNRFGERVSAGKWDGDLVEREVFQDVLQETRRRALVGLYGPGGCGKSVVIWQLLSQLQGSGCCTVTSARDLQQYWITNTVHNRRNLSIGNRPDDTAEEAIERLMIANSGSQRPIMWLALDGLDEGVEAADRESHIREVLRWFWDKDRERKSDNPPPATLIVSCRNKDDLREKWLELPPPPLYPGEPPLTMLIGDFSISEIEEAARKRLPELYRRTRLKSSIQSDVLERDYDTLPFGFASPQSQSDLIDERVWESLKHPAMWLALLSLDYPTQMRAIEGDQQSVYDLARRFIKWFHWKLVLREQRFRVLSDNDFTEVLRVIAQHSGGTPPYSRDENWVGPACHLPHINPREAIALWDQAVSAGLIMLDARLMWRWRHSIVHDYLISLMSRTEIG